MNLAGTLLTLKNMGIEDVVSFDFMDPPDKDSLVQVLFDVAYNVGFKTTLSYSSDYERREVDFFGERTVEAST